MRLGKGNGWRRNLRCGCLANRFVVHRNPCKSTQVLRTDLIDVSYHRVFRLDPSLHHHRYYKQALERLSEEVKLGHDDVDIVILSELHSRSIPPTASILHRHGCKQYLLASAIQPRQNTKSYSPVSISRIKWVAWRFASQTHKNGLHILQSAVIAVVLG